MPTRTIACICPDGFLVGDGGECNKVIPAPQCIVDSDCRTTEQCHSGNCLNACYVDKCGVNAICTARQHASTCACPPNYTGDPKKACYPSKSPFLLNCHLSFK